MTAPEPALGFGVIYHSLCKEAGVVGYPDLLQSSGGPTSLVLNGNCRDRFNQKFDDKHLAVVCNALRETGAVASVRLIDFSYTFIGSKDPEPTEEVGVGPPEVSPGIVALVQLLPLAESLTVLRLQHCDMTEISMTAIMETLVSTRGGCIAELDISGNTLGRAGHHLADVLSFGKVIRLRVASTCISLNSLMDLTLAMQGRWRIGGQSSDPLDEVQPVPADLEELILCSCLSSQYPAPSGDLEHFCEQLASSFSCCRALSRLGLSRLGFTDGCAASLTPALVSLAGLKELRLNANKFTYGAASSLAQLVAHFGPRLEVLNLSYNRLLGRGGTILAGGLVRGCPKALDLRHCSLDASGCLKVLEAVANSSSRGPTKLWLWYNGLQPTNSMAVAAALSHAGENLAVDCFDATFDEPTVRVFPFASAICTVSSPDGTMPLSVPCFTALCR